MPVTDPGIIPAPDQGPTSLSFLPGLSAVVPERRRRPEQRLADVENWTGGTLPTNLSLALSQSQLDDPYLKRASRLLARYFDLPVTWFFRPYDEWGSNHTVSARYVHEPGKPSEPMTWASAKRLIRPFEPKVIASMLGPAAGTYDTELIARYVRALAPLAGERVPFASIFGAVLTIAGSEGAAFSIDRFEANMKVVARSPSLEPLVAISIAQEAAHRGLTLESLADVAKLIMPEGAGAITYGQQFPTEAEAAARRAELAKAAAEGKPIPSTLTGVGGIPMEAGFGQALVQALRTPGDLTKLLQESQANYIKAGKELSATIQIPFTNSMVGHGIGWLLDKTNDVFESGLRLLGGVAEVPIEAAFPGIFGARAPGFIEANNQALRDARDIMLQRTNLSAQLEKELGFPPWLTVTTELFIAFRFPNLDPLIASGNVLRNVREARTLIGLAERGRASEWPELVHDFVFGRVGRIGDLRNVSTVQYLLREADRTKNAPTYFNRAVDNFRAVWSSDGISPIASERIWRFAQASRRSGLPQDLRERGVAEVLLSALGVRPTEGTLAAEIDAFYRAQRVATVEQLSLGLPKVETYGLAPAARLSRDAETALGVLNDTSLTLAYHGFLMTEVPHRAGLLTRAEHALRTSGLADTEVGRSIRTVFQQNPKRVAGGFTIAIENPAEAVRDFRRTLVRGQELSVNEIERAKLELTAALRPDNPVRELNFIHVVSKYDALQTVRAAERYGVAPALSSAERGDLVRLVAEYGWDDALVRFAELHPGTDLGRVLPEAMRRLEKTMGRTGPRKEAFGVEATPGPTGTLEPRTFAEPILVSQRPNQWQMLDPLAFRRAMAETAGTARMWRARIEGAFGQAITPAKKVKVPLRAFMDGAADVLVRDLFLSWFKPLVVVRPAYVLRVVGLEEQSRFLATAGLTRRVESGEHGARLASAVRGTSERVIDVPLNEIKGLEEGVLHFPRPGFLEGEPLANSVADQFAQGNQAGPLRRLLQQMFTGGWGTVTKSDPQFYDSWWNALVEQFGRDPLGRRYLDDIARGVSEPDSVDRAVAWLLDRNGEGPRYVQRLLGQPLRDVSQETLRLQVERGVHYAHDLTGAHPDLAAAARDGLLRMEDLRAVPRELVPAFVHGPLVNESVLARMGPMKKAVTEVQRWIMQEPTNRLSRQPYFKMWYDRMLRGLVQTSADNGITITEDLYKGFEETARQFGIDQVRRIMFDFTREGRIDELTRNVLMFVQPYLEWPVVWTRIIRQNPAMIGYAARLGRTAIDSGFVHKDPETGELTVPMSWWAAAAPLLAAVTGGQLRPIGQGGGWELSAPITSFNLFAQSTFMVPLGRFGGELPIPMPSLNPEAMWVFQQLVSHDAEIPGDLKASIKARLSSWLFAYGNVTPASLVPPYLRRFLEAAFPSLFATEADLQATHFLQVQQAMGLEPNVDLARKQAREFALIRGFFGLIFPAAPQIRFPTESLETEYRNLVDANGGDTLTANVEWLKIHPDLTLITQARTMWSKENSSPIPITPSKMVEQFLQTKGARQFAKDYPRWVWAIIPSELSDSSFDFGSWFSQLASGARVALSPEEFLSKASVQAGWDSYFAEQELWLAWQAAHPELGAGDPPYDKAALDHGAAIADIAAVHPEWAQRYGMIERQGVDPQVMAEARRLSKDSMFTKTDVGAGLVEYMDLRDKIATQLADNELHSVRTITAERLGITAAYDEGVAAITAAHPDFATAYRLFFFSDLQHVKTAGEKALDAIPQSVFDAQITPWWTRYEELRAAPNTASTEAARNMAYEAIRAQVSSAYSQFPRAENPMILRWRTWSPPEQGDYLLSMLGRGYSFYSQFDRDLILHEKPTSSTEKLWSTYNMARTAIAQSEDTNPNFSSTDAYAKLDAWVKIQAASSPEFGREVEAANTWGFAFGQMLDSPELRQAVFGSDVKGSLPYWRAFLDALGQVQAMVDTHALHGASDRGAPRVAYAALRTTLAGYAQQLATQSVAFRRQWSYLEDASGPDVLISYFMPDSWFRAGGDL